MANISGGQEPSFFGSGMYNVESYDIDKNAFYNDPNKKNNQQAQGILASTQNRQAPTVGQTQLGQVATSAPTNVNQQFRTGQAGLVNQLQESAAGRGPSLATSTLNQANAAAAASRMSQAASERGYGGGAATTRNLAYQQGAANQGNAIAAAQLRLQEQQQAQQALGSVLNSGRGADINEGQLNQNNNQFNATNQNQFTMDQAHLNQQTQLANQEAKLKTMGYNDAQIASMLGLSSNLNAQNQQNQIAYNNLGVEQNTALQGIQSQAFNNAAGHSLGSQAIGAIGGLAEAAGNLYTMGGASVAKEATKGITSDERQKTTFSKVSADKDMMQFLDKIGNHKYVYKNTDLEGSDDKIHFSPMAQELEKTNVGKTMVSDNEDGVKRVDYSRSLGTILSGLSLLNGRLKKLEN